MRQIINAKLKYIDSDSCFNNFSIDSRTIKDGDLFFCIKGEITDGHQYISQALEKGASAVVANQEQIPDELGKQNLLEFWFAECNNPICNNPMP